MVWQLLREVLGDKERPGAAGADGFSWGVPIIFVVDDPNGLPDFPGALEVRVDSRGPKVTDSRVAPAIRELRVSSAPVVRVVDNPEWMLASLGGAQESLLNLGWPGLACATLR